MTTDEATLKRPKIVTGFSVISRFCRFRLSRFAFKFSTEIFAPYGLFPPWSGFSEGVVSSKQFYCAICNWEYELFSPLWYQYFFRIDSSRISFPNLPSPQSEYLLSKSLPRSMHNQDIFLVKLFLPNWWSLDWSFGEDGWYSTIAPKGIIGPLHGSPNRLSYAVFHLPRGLGHVADSNSIPNNQTHNFSSKPDCNSTADVPSFTLRTALSPIPITFHRISASFFIPSCLQQYGWSSFFHSSFFQKYLSSRIDEVKSSMIPW